MSEYEVRDIAVQTWMLIGTVTTAVGAILFGLAQMFINWRQKRLAEIVAVAITPDPINSVIKVMNVGKINLYIHQADVGNTTHKLDRARLLTAGTLESAYQWFSLPTEMFPGVEFPITFYLTDDLGNRWKSEHAGCAQIIPVEKDGKQEQAVRILLWSYKTHRQNWSI